MKTYEYDDDDLNYLLLEIFQLYVLQSWWSQKCEKTIASCWEVKYVDFNLHWRILTSNPDYRLLKGFIETVV